MENIFTRTSQASENAPGFCNSVTTTFVFPNLHVGSRLFLSTRHNKITPTFPSFSFTGKAPWACGADHIEISFKVPPKDTFYFKWASLGGITVEDREINGSRIVKAEIKNFPDHDLEPFMVFPTDFPPSFTVSTLKSWSEIGAFYFQGEQKGDKPSAVKSLTPSADSTLKLKALSSKIVGSKKGKEAAEALYQWVSSNITYVALFLDFNDGFVPHDPMSILTNRYGDCKDKSLLLKILLEHQGIKSFSTLISSKADHAPPLPCEAYFDHVILYIPSFDLFLDPTQIYSSFGELGPDFSNHLVVVATSQGKQMRTPLPQACKNLYTAHSELSLNKDGTIHGKYTVETTGPSSTQLRGYFSAPFTPPEEFARNVLLSTPEGGAGTFFISTNPHDLNDPAKAKGEWITPTGFTLDGDGEAPVFLPLPYGLDIRLSLPFMRTYFTTQPRVFPFQAVAGIDTWTYALSLPVDVELFYLPPGQSLENKVGRYESTYELQGKKILVKRIFVLNKNIYEPEEQKDFMALVELLLLDLRQPLGIKKRVGT